VQGDISFKSKMTKGLNGTELDPAEEFPILYQLLTSPMSPLDLRLPNNTRKSSFSPVKKQDRKAPLVMKLEADSSVMSEGSYTSEEDYNISDPEDRMHQCVCKHADVVPTMGGKKRKARVKHEADNYPSSTTVDEEDTFDEFVWKKKKLHREPYMDDCD